MTKKEIKELAKQLMTEMDREGLDMEIVLDEGQLNKLADSIVDRLLAMHIREQQMWYTTNTLREHMKDMFSKPSNPDTEVELIGELAKLMTQMNMHMDNEEYEKCAELKKKIDIINKKLGNK